MSDDTKRDETEDGVRENDLSQAQENGDVDGSTNDETQALNDQRAEYVPVDPDARDYRVEGNDVRDYIGVDPEYMTYANETEAPGLTDKERFLYTEQYDHLEGNADEESEVPEGEHVVAVEGQLEDDPADYDAKVDITKLSDDEILALVWKDEDGDGRDDDTGLHETDFKYMQLGAKERKDHPETVVDGNTLGFPQ